MAFLAAGGQMSAYCRAKTCQDAGRVLTCIRFLCLARPGGTAAGLADGFILIGGEVPAKVGPVEPGRDVPAEIMRRLCANLPQLEEVISSRETRVAVELLIDTGRRSRKRGPAVRDRFSYPPVEISVLRDRDS